jgi:cyclophilin family peptidyl-prolyl cis-trans isomerase
MSDTENTLTLETTKGKVVILMRPDLAPGHVARIKELVREGFYDGVAFHRVIDGFMAQTGCPSPAPAAPARSSRRSSTTSRTAGARYRWRGRNLRIRATANSSSASQMRLFSTVSTPSGVK